MAVTTRNGFSIDPKLTTVVAPSGDSAKVIDNDDVKVAFEWYLDRYHDTVEKIITLSGFRSAAGNVATGTVGGPNDSNHRSGTALDVNGYRHPYEYTHRDKFRLSYSTTELAALRAILRSAKGAFRHGIDFQIGYRDPMHVEIAPGGFDNAKALAQRVREARVKGSMNIWLRRGWQRAVGVTPDGDLGTKSFTAIQRSINSANARGKFLKDGPLEVTGKFGNRDRIALIKYLNWLNSQSRFLSGGPLSTTKDLKSKRRNIALGKAINAGRIKETY